MTSVEVPYSIACALPSLTVLDITNDVAREVSRSPVTRGIAYVSAVEPASLVRVNERESGFFADVEELLARIVPMNAGARERMLLMLLGPRTEQIPVDDGRLCLGRYQRVLLFGFDGVTSAHFSLTLVG